MSVSALAKLRLSRRQRLFRTQSPSTPLLSPTSGCIAVAASLGSLDPAHQRSPAAAEALPALLGGRRAAPAAVEGLTAAASPVSRSRESRRPAVPLHRPPCRPHMRVLLRLPRDPPTHALCWRHVIILAISSSAVGLPAHKLHAAPRLARRAGCQAAAAASAGPLLPCCSSCGRARQGVVQRRAAAAAATLHLGGKHSVVGDCLAGQQRQQRHGG